MMDDFIIQFELLKNVQASICLDGDVPELLAGALTLIKCIHTQILLTGDKSGAAFFLEQINMAMNLPGHPLYEEVREMEKGIRELEDVE